VRSHLGAAMTTEAERQFANQTAPTQSDTEGVGVTILTATTTAANAALPPVLYNRYVTFLAKGDEIWLTFGPAGSANVDKSKAGGATFALGKDDQNGVPLANGESMRVRIDPTLNEQVSWQANAANSKLIVYPSSQARLR
jgi:hypothetical protein